jgi:hypothetical protein
MISGAVSARCPAAAFSRYSFVIAAGGGVKISVSRGGVERIGGIVVFADW